MRIGIVTRYARRELTFATIQLADILQAAGADVVMLGHGSRHDKVHPYWDGRVIWADCVDQHAWLGTPDLLIWTHCPLPDTLERGAARHIPSILVLPPRDFSPLFLRAYQLFDRVVAPSLVGARTLLDLGVPGVVGCPWSLAAPPAPAASGIAVDAVGVFPASFPTVAHFQEFIDDLYKKKSELAHHPKCQHVRAKKQRKHLNGHTPSSLTLLGAQDYYCLADAIQLNKVTLMGGVGEGFALDLLASLHSGVPVLGPSNPVFDEVVIHSVNGISVPGGDASPSLLVDALADIVRDSGRLAWLRSNAGIGLEQRRADFVRFWVTLVEMTHRRRWSGGKAAAGDMDDSAV